MFKPLLLLSLSFSVQTVFGHKMFENFETGIPTYFTATQTSSLSSQTAHKKGGAKSLGWNAKSNDVLTVSNLAIPSGTINNTTSGTARFWIYSQTATNDTLIFRFYE